MQYYSRLSRPTWGMSLFAMRRLYLTNVRPKLTYACATWFLRGPARWTLNDKLVGKLESAQYQCLMLVAGAFSQTARLYLRKELNIEPLEIHLERCASAARARALDPNIQEDPSPIREFPRANMPPSMLKKFLRHPYYVNDCQAKKVQRKAWEHLTEHNDAVGQCNSTAPPKDWGNQKHRAKAINLSARLIAEKSASDEWRAWRTTRLMNRRKNAPALWDEEWSRKSLNLYRHLPRAESTILLQCRTGFMGLRSQLYRMKVSTCK